MKLRRLRRAAPRRSRRCRCATCCTDAQTSGGLLVSAASDSGPRPCSGKSARPVATPRPPSSGHRGRPAPDRGFGRIGALYRARPDAPIAALTPLRSAAGAPPRAGRAAPPPTGPPAPPFRATADAGHIASRLLPARQLRGGLGVHLSKPPLREQAVRRQRPRRSDHHPPVRKPTALPTPDAPPPDAWPIAARLVPTGRVPTRLVPTHCCPADSCVGFGTHSVGIHDLERVTWTAAKAPSQSPLPLARPPRVKSAAP